MYVILASAFNSPSECQCTLSGTYVGLLLLSIDSLPRLPKKYSVLCQPVQFINYNVYTPTTHILPATSPDATLKFNSKYGMYVSKVLKKGD